MSLGCTIREITRAEVPLYLQGGLYFCSLDADDKDNFTVPANTFKMVDSFGNCVELKHLLESLCYWQVDCDKYEVEIIGLLVNKPLTDDVLCLLAQFEIVFPLISKLKRVLSETGVPALDVAAQVGPLNLVKALLQHGGCQPTLTTLEFAVAGGQLDILQFLIDEYRRLQIVTCEDDMKLVIERAAGDGCLASLQILLNNGYESRSACYHAAKNGQLECLEYLHNCESHLYVNTSLVAASNGHLNILHFLHEKNCPFHGKCCRAAASRGHLDCLQYLRSIGKPWGVYVPSQAALGGHLNCLRYARENGCDWDETTCADAAEGGQLECLQYAHENGCPWDKRTTTNAVKHFPCLEYALERRCAYESDLAEIAFKSDANDSGFFVLQHCENVSTTIYTYAAERGRRDIMEAAFDAGVPWHENTCAVAAAAGHVACLNYALSHGAPAVETPVVREPTQEEIMVNLLYVEQESFFC